jgi:hypothetical protein
VIASLAAWATDVPVVLVVAGALVAFLAALAILVVAGVLAGAAIARVGSRRGRRRNR